MVYLLKVVVSSVLHVLFDELPQAELSNIIVTITLMSVKQYLVY
jgi:hypothetical protein